MTNFLSLTAWFLKEVHYQLAISLYQLSHYLPIFHMEKYKIVILAIFAIPLSAIIFSDNTQFKRIGKTHFYLLPIGVDDIKICLYHDDGSRSNGPCIGINQEGQICDVFWNQQYVITKNSNTKNGPIKHWYIMNNIKTYSWKELGIREFSNITDYSNALDSIGLQEKQMRHTDNTIPWRLHLY